MGWTKAEYRNYQTTIREFKQRLGVDRIATGHLRCPECSSEWNDDRCPKGCGTREELEAPYISKRGCDVCGNPLQQEVEPIVAFSSSQDDERMLEFQACSDCVYYNEYGRLPDMMMAEIEADRSEENMIIESDEIDPNVWNKAVNAMRSLEGMPDIILMWHPYECHWVCKIRVANGTEYVGISTTANEAIKLSTEYAEQSVQSTEETQ